MIPIQNIYYMLAYAFRILQENGYANLGAESFQNTPDLLSAILVRGVGIQIKRGLLKGYVNFTEPLHTPRGKMEITDTVRHQTLRRQQIICSHDEFSANIYPNQILATTMEYLLRFGIPPERKKELRRLLVYFKGVDRLPPRKIQWKLRYHRNNQSYRMLISICYLVMEGLLQTQQDGSLHMMDFLDDQRMCQLYEKFILEYYRKEHRWLDDASPRQINWALDGDDSGLLLPVMQTDITLTHGNRQLIIDAKYYSHTTQVQYGRHTIHSNNLYQIFAYVQNQSVHFSGDVSGMLLYAQTDDMVQPDETYHIRGNTIRITTLDLNKEFSHIREKLDAVAESLR